MDHKREHRTPPLARVMGVGRQQYLMVDGETYECVKKFCYLGDTLDGDGGADLAATARIRNGWMKFRELLPFLTSRAPPLEMKGRVYASCVRSSMTYGSETRPLLLLFAFQSGPSQSSIPASIAEFPDCIHRSVHKSDGVIVVG